VKLIEASLGCLPLPQAKIVAKVVEELLQGSLDLFAEVMLEQHDIHF